MNKKLYSGIALAILLVMAPYNSTHAALFNWITGNASSILAASSDDTSRWSLDQFYGSLAVSGDQKNPITIQGNAVGGSSNPTAVTPRVQKTKRILMVEASGYSSTPDQTDDSPFITASGTYVRDGIIATNILPFGTAVKIPAIFGNKIFVVEDRMNRRYQQNIDVWFPTREAALEFGRKQVKVEVVI